MDQLLNKITKLKKSNRGSKLVESKGLNDNVQMSSSSNNNNGEEGEDEFFLAVWSPLKKIEEPRPEFHRGELEKLSDDITNHQEEEPCSIVGVVYKHVGDINFPTTAPASMRSNKTKRVRFQKSQITESIIVISEEDNEISDIKSKVTESTLPVEMDINEKKRLALEESHKQNIVMLQISKAIRFAKPESIEEVECQRILLLSELKRQAILGHLPILSLIDQKPKDTLYEVKLKSISLSHKLTISNIEKREDTNYYVCIATSGMTVLSTNICKDAETISFNNDLFFEKLLPNFSIILAIYKLGFKSLTEKQKESKWLKLKTIFKKKAGGKDSALDFIATSKFNYVGRCILHRRNVTANLGYFKLVDLSITSNLDTYVAIDCEIYS